MTYQQFGVIYKQKKRSNPFGLLRSAQRAKGCFAPLAMTTLAVLYEVWLVSTT